MKLHLSEQVCLCCRGNNVYKEIGDHEADDDDDDHDNDDDDDDHLASTIVVVNGDFPMELSVQPGALCA